MNKKIIGILIVVIVLIVGGLLAFNPLDKTVVDTPKENVKPVEEVDKDPVVAAPDDKPVAAEIATGKPAPDFTLKNLSGDDVSLSDYKGKIVLLNFWATWCSYCDKEMPDLQKLSKENDDLVILAVDVMEDKALVEEYIKKGGYDFEVVLDADGEIAKTYVVGGYPTSYFIDEEGLLIGAVPGMMTYEQMIEVMDKIRE